MLSPPPRVSLQCLLPTHRKEGRKEEVLQEQDKTRQLGLGVAQRRRGSFSGWEALLPPTSLAQVPGQLTRQRCGPTEALNDFTEKTKAREISQGRDMTIAGQHLHMNLFFRESKTYLGFCWPWKRATKVYQKKIEEVSLRGKANLKWESDRGVYRIMYNS